MAKVEYKVCDICNRNIHVDNKYQMFIHIMFGLDICQNCLDKLKQLSIDRKNEEKCMAEISKRTNKYENVDCKSAYYEGVEDALSVLSHHRLKKLADMWEYKTI